ILNTNFKDVKYTVMLNENGGIVDDLFSYTFSDEEILLVVNAANIEKDFNHIKKYLWEGLELINESDEVVEFAVQGPKAEELLQNFTSYDLKNIKYFNFDIIEIFGEKLLISRTGYTGEDGFEILISSCSINESMKAEKIWDMILTIGKNVNLLPCGLGARDTLRLEAGMVLYGQDIDENTTPLEAKLDWLIPMDKVNDYVGKRAILEQMKKGVEKVRIGFVMKEKGIPRTGYEILIDNKVVGKVTSGTFSPILKKGIGMGYIPKDLEQLGKELSISIRGVLSNAIITKPPFYDTEKYGLNRKMKSI
ncbi:MAG: glycine cleavage system aminomethyltransferase GcvT, partial [Nitrososphaerales archaeon]